MLASERRDLILELLGGEGRVVASDLAPRLGVSLDTVRRDLDGLAAAGALRRVHGGALPLGAALRRPPDRVDVDATHAIAAAACSLVHPGAVVLLGGGTAVLELARRLPGDLRATIVTSAPGVAVALLDHRSLEVVLLGGRVHAATRTVIGGEAVDTLRSLRADLCLLGSCSLHAEAGLTAGDREEAIVARAMIERSSQTAVLADASGLGAGGAHVVGAAEAVDVLVTDVTAPAEALAGLVALGIEVIRV